MPGSQNVTDQFASIPMPPIATFVGGMDVMAGAEEKSYLGKLTEQEAKQLVTRSVTLTRWSDMLLDLLANDSRFGYESKAEIMRQAIDMLLDYYRESNAFLAEHSGFASEVLRRQFGMRLDAERARVRHELRDNLGVFDDEMDTARELGDWSHIAYRLNDYREILRACQSETERKGVRDTIAGSVVTRGAAVAFYRWTHARYRTPVDDWKDEWPGLAEDWVQFFADATPPRGADDAKVPKVNGGTGMVLGINTDAAAPDAEEEQTDAPEVATEESVPSEGGGDDSSD